jgi:hypothetical protein
MHKHVELITNFIFFCYKITLNAKKLEKTPEILFEPK